MKGFKDSTKTQYATGPGGVKGAAKVAQVTGDFKRGCAKPVKKAMGGPIRANMAGALQQAAAQASPQAQQGLQRAQQAVQAAGPQIKQAIQQRMQARKGVPVASRQPLIRRPG